MANNTFTILVIDDLQDNLITLNALIKDAFPEAITLNAQSGEKGLDLAAKANPDVILLDILMPGMDGYEVCQKLKADKELCDIPVVFVTAIENNKEALLKALDSGGEAFLTKPIDEIELIAQIRAMLKIKEANSAKKDEKVRLEKLVKKRNKELVKELAARKQTEEKLKKSEAKVRKKMKAILEPEGDITSLELSDIIDTGMLQSMMNDFYRLTGMLGAVIDISGKVLVAVGWQDICTKFHRCHPDTLKNCIESDTVLTNGVAEGEFKSYRCKNNMWDIVTPIMIDGKHFGNVFMGQYFLEGEVPDIELFRRQAKKYDFDEQEYLAALDRVPRFNKKTVEEGMQFYSKLAKLISTLSYSSIQQSRMLAQQKQAEADLLKAKEHVEESEEKFRGIYEQSPIAIEIYDKHGKLIDVNQQTLNMFGVDDKKHVLGFDLWADPNLSDEKMKLLKSGQEIFLSSEFDFEVVKENKLYPTSRSGKIYMDMYAIPLFNEKKISGFLVQIVEVTERKQAEETLKESQNLLQQAENVSNQGSWKWDITNDVWSFSENWLKIHGFEDSGIRRDELMKIAHPDDKLKIDIAFENALSNKKTYSIEHRIIRKDNAAVRHIKAEGEVHFLDNGKPDYMIGIAQDITERKQAEKALKESEEKFKTIVENGSVLLTLTDSLGRIEFASPQCESVIGWKEEDIIGVNMPDFIHPDDIKRVAVERAKVTINQPIKELEYRIIDKENKIRWISHSAATIKKGDAFGILSTITNLTKRKHAEESNKELLKRFELIGLHLRGVIYQFRRRNDGSFHFPYASHGIMMIYGVTPQEVEHDASKAFKAIHPDDLERVSASINHSAQTLKPWHDVYRVNQPSGKTIWVEGNSTPIKLEDGSIIWHGFIQDITERKQAEAELIKLSTAVTQSPSVIAITDTNGKLEYVNPQFTISTGYSMKEAIGHNPSVLKSGEQSDEMYKELWKTISSGKIWRGEFHNRKKNGELFWEIASVSPIFDEQGKIINYIKVAEDITERKQAEDNFKHSIDESPLGIRIVTQKGKTIYVNKALLDIYEFSSPEEFLNTRTIETYTEQSYQEHQERKKLGKEAAMLMIMKSASVGKMEKSGT